MGAERNAKKFPFPNSIRKPVGGRAAEEKEGALPQGPLHAMEEQENCEKKALSYGYHSVQVWKTRPVSANDVQEPVLKRRQNDQLVRPLWCQSRALELGHGALAGG